jgi:enoyl-[acyl-carrier-protein] reductase (NADH)
MGMSYEEMVEKVFKSKTLTGELNTVEQVAAVAVLLASETGRGITGSFFNVDGGQSPTDPRELGDPARCGYSYSSMTLPNGSRP